MVIAPVPLDERCVNTLRFLAVDMVQKVGSGHPGLPLGSAAMAYALWDCFLYFNPADPLWLVLLEGQELPGIAALADKPP